MSDQQTGLQKDVFSVVSHDLKTPINAVRGFIELVQYTGELNERQQYFCERALLSLEKMQSLVESLLETAKTEGSIQFQFASCDLKRVIQEKVELLEGLLEQRQLTLHQDVDSELATVWGDEERLGQVVVNLLGNAIKYSEVGGHIWITAINQPDYIRISVRDSGPGVPLSDQEYIFDAFYRASHHEKAEGSGLGLA
ncbi:MAG: HAMP domain-containing histidine kinase, partial [Anaerolineae bacterium]|nr:HAMP domain-containing histidine kinase [Anaerolineae bacterium]